MDIRPGLLNAGIAARSSVRIASCFDISTEPNTNLTQLSPDNRRSVTNIQFRYGNVNARGNDCPLINFNRGALH